MAVYNPLTFEISIPPFELPIREPSAPSSPEAVEAAVAPALGSIEPRETSPIGSPGPEAFLSLSEMQVDIEGPSGSKHDSDSEKTDSEDQDFILKPRDPTLSALEIETDEGGDVIIDTTRLDEVIASIQPQPILPLIPLDLNKPLLITDAVAAAAIERACEFEEENQGVSPQPIQPSVADETTAEKA